MYDAGDFRDTRAFRTWLSALSKSLGYDNEEGINGGFYILSVLLTFVGLSFGSVVTILFLGSDCWRAFKQRKHWIPGDSLLLGALSLQLLLLIGKPSLDFPFHDRTTTSPLHYACKYLNLIHGEWILVLVGRVSTCVLMGYLLPGVATPLSPNLRTDMAALFISFALVAIHIISHELFILPSAYQISGYVIESDVPTSSLNHILYSCPKHLWNSVFMELANVIVLVSMITLALLLGCAASASIGIHEIVSREIPRLLSAFKISPHLYPPKILWEKIEDQVVKSWIVVRTSNPQYIISRSVFSSLVALIIMVCNSVVVFQLARCSYKTIEFTDWAYYSNRFYPVNSVDDNRQDYDTVSHHHEGCVRPPISIPLILHYTVIFLGSTVIYCRSVTAVIYYPRGIRWKLCNVRGFWKVETFWLSHLLDLKESSKSHKMGITGERFLTKLIVNILRRLRLHRLLPLIIWLQIFFVFFGKGCWLLSELLFSNNFFRKLVMGSASHGYSLYIERGRGETQFELDPAYSENGEACVAMPGESTAGLWFANKTAIQDLKKRVQKGEEEGKICNELIALLTDKSSRGFSGQRYLKPGPALGLDVETELNVKQRSCKITVVSILSLLSQLSTFIHDENERKDMTYRVMKACSQAWNIMDVVEYLESESPALIKAADALLHKFKKEHKWLDHRLPITESADMSPKAAVENMFERGKEVAIAYDSRAWEEVAAAYNMCRLCRRIVNEYEFDTVEGVLDILQGVLADVIGSCIAKAALVVAEDCKKWATNLEEERIWKAAKVVGKVKGITEKTGLMLEASPRSNIDHSATHNRRHSFKWLEKFPTMTR